MSEKPSPPKALRVLVGDSMSTKNFQELRAAKMKIAGTPSASVDSDTYVTRADSMSTANFQTRAAKAKPATPAIQSANTSTAVPTPVKPLLVRAPGDKRG